MNWPRACGSTNGARSPEDDRNDSAETPLAPGGLAVSRSSRSATPAPTIRNTQSRFAVPTIAGITRRYRSACGVASHIPAASVSGSIATSSRSTWQPSVVPITSAPSPSSRTPEPNAQAGRSNGPADTGNPEDSPNSVALRESSANSRPGGAGSASSRRYPLSPQASSAAAL